MSTQATGREKEIERRGIRWNEFSTAVANMLNARKDRPISTPAIAFFMYLTEKRDGQLPELLRVANVAKDNLVERQAVRLGRGELLLVLERLDHKLAADCKSRCAVAIPSQKTRQWLRIPKEAPNTFWRRQQSRHTRILRSHQLRVDIADQRLGRERARGKARGRRRGCRHSENSNHE
jgi:hypothetical protein